MEKENENKQLEITGEMLDEQVRKALYVLLTRSMQEGLGTSAAGFATAFKQIVDSMDELRAKRVFDEPALTRVQEVVNASWSLDGNTVVFYDEDGNINSEHSVDHGGDLGDLGRLDSVPKAVKIEKPEVFVYAIRRKMDGSWYTRSSGFVPSQKKARIYRRKCDASSSFNKNQFSQTTCEVVRFGCLET